MKSYADSGQPADFEVRYRFYAVAEGGRAAAPRQHLRWNFLYEDDDISPQDQWMIWPEFVDAAGDPFPEGEVPREGLARMFISRPETRMQVHRQRIRVGTRGYMVEGAQKVAECEVTRVLGLHTNQR